MSESERLKRRSTLGKYEMERCCGGSVIVRDMAKAAVPPLPHKGQLGRLRKRDPDVGGRGVGYFSSV